jgi:aconitate hydratase
MGVLPLEFVEGEDPKTLGLTGRELFDVEGVASGLAPRGELVVRARDGGATRQFRARVRIDTPNELDYYRHGGILPYVVRQMLRV